MLPRVLTFFIQYHQSLSYLSKRRNPAWIVPGFIQDPANMLETKNYSFFLSTSITH